jgi:hypothetical protein
MKIGNIIEFHLQGKKIIHTGKIIKINDKSIIVVDDKTGLETKVLKVDMGLGYE